MRVENRGLNAAFMMYKKTIMILIYLMFHSIIKLTIKTYVKRFRFFVSHFIIWSIIGVFFDKLFSFFAYLNMKEFTK